MRVIVVILTALLLAACDSYQWGTVVGVQERGSAWHCNGALPISTVRLDDGRLIAMCAQAPLGERVQVCPQGVNSRCRSGTLEPDRLAGTED